MSRRCCSIVEGGSSKSVVRLVGVFLGRMERDRIKAAKLGCRWCTEPDLGAERKRERQRVGVDLAAGCSGLEQ